MFFFFLSLSLSRKGWGAAEKQKKKKRFSFHFSKAGLKWRGHCAGPDACPASLLGDAKAILRRRKCIAERYMVMGVDEVVQVSKDAHVLYSKSEVLLFQLRLFQLLP